MYVEKCLFQYKICTLTYLNKSLPKQDQKINILGEFAMRRRALDNLDPHSCYLYYSVGSRFYLKLMLRTKTHNYAS